MARANLGVRVERYLQRHLRSVEAGAPLPSFRTIMKACGVGPHTVRQVLDELSPRGLLVVQPQRGIFAGELAAAQRALLAVSSLDLIFFQGRRGNPLLPFHDELIRLLTEYATMRGYGVRFHLLDTYGGAREALRELAANPRTQACLPINLPQPDLLHPLAEEQLPFVNLFPACPTIPPNSVLIDPEAVVQLQVEHLVSHGHRRIGYLHNLRPYTFHRDLVLRREAFYRQALDCALPITSHWVRYAGYGADERRAGVHALLSLEPRPTALICTDDHLPEVYHAASELGLLIGRGLSIVGTNDDPVAERLYPPATSVRIPRDVAAQLALDNLEQVIRRTDPLPQPVCIVPELVVRESVGRIG
jgi:DNA-binding LacI/PurR family transcriptional regulator